LKRLALLLPPLRYSLPVLLVVFVIAINLSSYWYSIPQAQKQVEHEVQANFLEIINRTQGTIRYMLQHNDNEGMVREITNLGGVEGFKLAMLFDDENVVVASTRFSYLAQRLNNLVGTITHLDTAAYHRAKQRFASEKQWSVDHRLLTGYFPVPIGLSISSLRSDRIGMLYVEFDATWRKERISQILLNQNIQISLFSTVLLLILLFYLHFSLTRRATRLVKSASEINAGNFHNRIKLQGQDELAMIGSAFDQMVGRLEREQRLLAASEKRQRAILDHTSDGIITIDQSGEILSANASSAQLFGFTPAQMQEKNLLKLVFHTPSMSQEHHHRREMTIAELKAGSNRLELEARRNDGLLLNIELSITEAEIDEAFIYIGVLRDITERKKIERIKEDFIAMVSHELRTPLTSIRGSLGLLNGGVMGELSEKVHAMISIAYSNTERLTKLVNDLLDLQKTEAGKLSFDIKPYPLAELLADAIANNQPIAIRTNIDLKLLSSPDNLEVNIDATRFQQVMANLISNACKFSRPGGMITIDACMQGERRVRVSVQDFGSGIPDAFRAHIFEKFSQADSSSTRAKEGTGLGLAICKELIMRMDGELAFDSVVGSGTTFYFTLPVMPPQTRT
jgi:PAS domain S-box-containing protein